MNLGQAGFDLVAHAVGPDGALAPRGRPLFRLESARLEYYAPVPGFDVSLDGQWFLFAQYEDTPPPPPPHQIHIIENWFEELRTKAPATQ